MSKINEIMDKVGEITHLYPNLDLYYILVAPKLLSEMLAELYGSASSQHCKPHIGGGFESLALQTRRGQLYVKTELDLEYDDFVLINRSGERYSYKYFFVSEMIENIILRDL